MPVAHGAQRRLLTLAVSSACRVRLTNWLSQRKMFGSRSAFRTWLKKPVEVVLVPKQSRATSALERSVKRDDYRQADYQRQGHRTYREDDSK